MKHKTRSIVAHELVDHLLIPYGIMETLLSDNEHSS